MKSNFLSHMEKGVSKVNLKSFSRETFSCFQHFHIANECSFCGCRREGIGPLGTLEGCREGGEEGEGKEGAGKEGREENNFL